MPTTTVSQRIACEDSRAVYALICDMERFPSFMPDLVSVTVLEREAGRTVTAWEAKVDGLTLRWQEEDTFDEARMRISYRQLAGDLRRFEGAWQIVPEDGGARVELTADFDLGIPMLAPLVEPLLTKRIEENCRGMLRAIEAEYTRAAAFGQGGARVVSTL